VRRRRRRRRSSPEYRGAYDLYSVSALPSVSSVGFWYGLNSHDELNYLFDSEENFLRNQLSIGILDSTNKFLSLKKSKSIEFEYFLTILSTLY
jgi:hypothetical protein